MKRKEAEAKTRRDQLTLLHEGMKGLASNPWLDRSTEGIAIQKVATAVDALACMMAADTFDVEDNVESTD